MSHLRGPARALTPFAPPLPLTLASTLPRSSGSSAPLLHTHLFSALHRPPPEYPGHVPINNFERATLAIGSLLGSFFNPRRADLIALAGETTSTPYFLPRLLHIMQSDPTGRHLLRHRPQVTASSIPSIPTLLKYPANTLGHIYAMWLHVNHLSPFTRPPVRYLPTAELAYTLFRYRQSHDFYHSITGLPPIREGEVALKLFEWCNLGLPMTGLASFAYVTLKDEEKRRCREVYFPWAVRAGTTARCLINVWWERELSTDVDELRERLALEVPPDMRAMRRAERKAQKGATPPSPPPRPPPPPLSPPRIPTQ